ncbi:hypothetical protein Psi01_59310 [Planobispora siamensis]|uniref:Uncharacterized protein n=2 Tax=Planobispora siamensis TaxID=936338 RepID=A0A8J3SMI0_9ACTN|nr:hypothetical protein Psi01_59310 [Planobispora siamensis]
MRRIEYLPLDDVPFALRNPKDHELAGIRAAIQQFGCTLAGALDERTGRLVFGHGRLSALRQLHADGARLPDGLIRGDDGRWRVPILRGWSSASDADADAYIIADNKLTERGGWVDHLLADVLGDLASDHPDLLELTGFTATDLADIIADLDRRADTSSPDSDFDDDWEAGDRDESGPPVALAERFLVAPFTVLDARTGWWRQRKRAWLELGIRSEIGRTAKTFNTEGSGINAYDQMTSIFDPVVCELVYRWFSPPGASVIDPFAGGSVRGVVAAALGRRYHGNDLSADQVDANRAQAKEMAARDVIASVPDWNVGDSIDWVTTLEPESADLLFTCPPYLWLERYSDDPADLSTMGEQEFIDAYGRIIAGAAAALRPDRFAAIVVGDVRHPRTGRLVDLRGITIRAAEAAGLTLQSTAFIMTVIGSLARRVGPQFVKSRLLGRTHQDLLIFVKGDRKRAAQACGPVDVGALEAFADADDGTGDD